MGTLKIVVVALGVLLVAAFGLLIFGLTQNWQKLATPAPTAGMAASVRSWGNVDVPQARAARVQHITAAGSLVVLHLSAPGDDHGGGGRLVVLDPASGAIVGTFTLSGTP